MKRWLALGIGAVAVLAVGFVMGMAVGGGKDVVPQPDVRAVGRPSFGTDIQPIFNEFCVACHGPEDAHNGLRLDSYEGVMKGTNFGPVVYPNQPDLSNLMAVLKRETSPSIWMPYHRDSLTPNRIKNIETWIRNGAPNN